MLDVVVAADNDVVEELDAQQLAGLIEFPRGPGVLWDSASDRGMDGCGRR